jgi:aryl-alcohol dehydrogenase-like predicted oxidoreductase
MISTPSLANYPHLYINKIPGMNYRKLGNSTLNISEIGFGCMSLGNDDAQSRLLLNKAFDAGINFFDTADMYGNGSNEVQVGSALKDKRQQVIISTKVGNQWRPDGSGWDWNPRKDYILSSVDKSLQRLQTDYIDLYLLHGGTIDDPIDETIEAFETLKQQGKILFYGISSIRPNVIREYVGRSKIVAVMMQYSLLDRRPEESCLPLLEEKNIGVLARGSVAKGLIVDKPAKPFLNIAEADVSRAASAVRAISGDKRTAAQTAIRFALKPHVVSSAVVGIRTEEQLRDAVKTAEAPPLTDEELQTLVSSIPVNKYDQHR